MIFKKFGDLELSALGFGSMRLPTVDGDDSQIDEAAAAEMVDLAIKKGVNYFDTAWGYHGGNSERVMGKCLKKYPRDSFYLASKFPGYDLSNMPKVKEIFPEQLSKCRTGYFDFYLIHNVCEMNINEYLDPKYGIMDYLLEQKKQGKIRHLGFSAHGEIDVMKRFLEAYGEHMEFGQIQLNWLDWTFQNAKGKTELLESYSIPIWIMEPVRGGKLAKLSDKDEAALKALRPDESIAAWAFRFIQSLPGVGVTLSGMSDMKQLTENIAVFEEEKPLSDKEMQTLMDIADDMQKSSSLPCTGCRYCVSHCPQGLDIPMLIGLYNEHILSGGGFIAPMALMAVADDKKPSACVGCRSCEAVCPQQIKVSEAMADFHAKLN